MKDMLSLRKEIVWVHLGKEHFPPGKYVKIKPVVDDLFKVLLRIGENAYKIELPDNYAVHLLSIFLIFLLFILVTVI